MINQKDLKKLPPADRLTRLKELAEERKRELQLIDQLLQETTSELRKKASLPHEEASLAQQLVRAASTEAKEHEITEATLDSRLAAEVTALFGDRALQDRARQEERALHPADAGLATPPVPYQAATATTPASGQDTADIQKEYQPLESYSTFKQIGYENTWQQRDMSKDKEEETKKKREDDRARFFFP